MSDDKDIDTQHGDGADNAPGASSGAARPRRRWLRRTLTALAALLVVFGGAVWLLGRESTLQQLVRRVAAASGGEIAVSGVSGSLYHRMHIGHLVYRDAGSAITADDIDINWSPLQFFSEGIAISELHIASLAVQSIGPSKPAVLPASLAAPFRLSLSDARIGKLLLIDADGARNEIDNLSLQLYGDKTSWHVQDASAQTGIGAVHADVTVGAQRPFALTGSASLTQSLAAGSTPAQLTLQARGNLSQLQLTAKATSNQASGDATLLLAPFDPVILHALTIDGRNLNPAGFNPNWPRANLSLHIAAHIEANQKISGSVELLNPGQSGPLDQQRLPLQRFAGNLNGTLTATTIDDVTFDLGAAGRFDGGGSIERSAPDAGIGSATFKLYTARLDLKGISSSLNKTAIAGDITLRDIGAKGANKLTLDAALAQDGLRLDLQATLANALLQIQQARLLAKKGSISLTGQASLKDAQPFKAAVGVAHFDPSALGAYPVADLNADINASGHLSPAWQVAASFAIKPSKLDGLPLSGTGKLDADASHVSDIDAKLALGQNRADLRGSFGAAGEKLNWHVDARQPSALSANLLGTLTASGIISGSMDAPRSSFEADAKGLGLASAKHLVADSALHTSGDIWLSGGAKRHAEIKLSGSAQHFNPAAFGAYPNGSINGDFSGAASLAADWHASVNLKLLPSTLSDATLSGHATLTADARHIDQADVDLQLGTDSLQARGSFGDARDRLDWKLDAPQLASIGPQFGGALHAAGTLAGSIAQPALNLTLDGSNVRLPGQRQIASVRGSASLDSAGTVAADINLAGFASSALNLTGARLQASGTRSAHTLQLSANNPDFDAALRIKGGFVADGWSGAIDTLQNRGRFALTLQAPAPLRVNGAAGSGIAGLAHPQQINLSGFALNLPNGSIRIDSLSKDGAQWGSKGQAAGVPVNYLAQLSDAWRDNVKSDMTLGAAWSLNLQAATQGGTPAIDGMLHVYREKGDLTVLGGDQSLPLGLRQLDTRADVANGALRLQFLMDGSHGGQARVDATAQLRDGHLNSDSPLTLSGSANMGSLSWLAPLAGQPGLELDGTLKVSMSGSGTVGAPQLSGDVSGAQLTVNWADQGIKLHNGQLQATLSGDQLQLQKLAFDGSKGHAQADGWIRFADEQATMQLKLSASQLEVLSRPDRSLTVSGQSTLVRDAKHFELDGKFKADHASIELASQDTPTLSDDVVIVGKSAPPAKPAAQSMPLNIDVEADLGDDFNLKGKGLDAQLAGAVRVRVADRRPPRVTGSIRVVSGTYAAYGQKLAIDRGVINFTGAYDNPGLNILAVRKRPEDEPLSDTNVEAGVEVRGTALAPSAKLVSTPAVSDSDKLAWLVLGHGMDTAGSNDMALLGTAAGALFGGGQGQLANKLGLDELGVGQASGTPVAPTGTSQATALQTTVVTVGKRISSRAYLSFEQGTSTATSLVKLRYKLNPRITLQFQTGTNNALDVLYTWAFD